MISAAQCCAVVVNYRCAELSATCVQSLREQAPELRIIIVENGSGDSSEQLLRARLGALHACRLLVEERNGGFGAGCNRGIEAAMADPDPPRYLLLINPDARAGTGCLEELLACAERHPEAGIVGGRILSDPPGRVLYENGRWRPWTLGASHVPAPPGRAEFETTFISGALMLIAGDLLAAGLRFDEAFFLYVEDLDLCCEVRARGRSLWVTMRAELHHREGGSQGGEDELVGGLRTRQLHYLARNKVYLARKRLSHAQRLVFFAVALFLKPLAGLALARSPRFLPAYCGGLWAGLRMPLRGSLERTLLPGSR